LIKDNKRQCIFACSAISIQPVSDAKLNPFNADWSTEYFKSCEPNAEGDFNNVRFEIVCMPFQVFCIAVLDLAARVDYTDVLASTFAPA
jgi:hypothetical protein